MLKWTSLLAALIVAFTFTVDQASAQRRIRVGTLACNIAPSVGLIIGSSTQLRCRFGGQVYRGAIRRLGLDVGVTAGGRLAWAVFASTRGLPRRALAGSYVGASGDASLGVGGGGNLLVGGSNRSIVLQPLSIRGQAGVNVALGVAALTLE
jgi:hypothetical protein